MSSSDNVTAVVSVLVRADADHDYAYGAAGRQTPDSTSVVPKTSSDIRTWPTLRSTSYLRVSAHLLHRHNYVVLAIFYFTVTGFMIDIARTSRPLSVMVCHLFVCHEFVCLFAEAKQLLQRLTSFDENLSTASRSCSVKETSGQRSKSPRQKINFS